MAFHERSVIYSIVPMALHLPHLYGVANRRANLHIHGNLASGQALLLGATQSAQRTSEANRAALAVRKRLANATATSDADSSIPIEDSPQDKPPSRQKKSPLDEDKFRSVFFSLSL